MDDLNAIELAERFHYVPMVAECNDLVETEHIAAVLNIIHLDLY